LRSAISLLEITVSAAMLAVLMIVAAQMLDALRSQQRGVQRRALALQTVQALAEQVGNMRWDKLTVEAAEEIIIPTVALAHLPGAKLSIAVDEEREPIPAKRVRFELMWNDASGQSSGPAQLTTWVYPSESLPQ
jgi:hypothetical protein